MDAMNTRKNNNNPHAIMIPLGYQGHVTPFVNLALKLASKGFTITFVNTQIIHHQITKSSQQQQQQQQQQQHDDIFAGARESLGLDIRYRTVSDGFPLGFDRMLYQERFLEGNLHVFPAHVDELVGDLVKNDASVTCLIADTFHTWTSEIAEKYRLVSVSFWTEPALAFTQYYHWDLLIVNGHFASLDNRDDAIDYIPGVEAIEPQDLVSFLQSSDTKTVIHRVLYKAFEDVKKADFVLCNTVQELEADTILALQDKQPFYAIGPVFPSEISKCIVPTSLRRAFDCSRWLDTKPEGSVLYVSFGSFIPSTKNDVDEIAHGLALSKVNFVWVVRPGTVSFGQEFYVLPEGFEDEVGDKGLVLTWTDQIEVLSHPAVGGFLTHCGWNSILESVWCGGIPLLCFPLLTDQPTNRKIVVEDWRIGINLCDRKPLSRSEVAEKISCLMSRKSGQELRKEAAKVRQTFENSLAMDGSSEKNLCHFITEVKAKITKNGRL